MILLIMSVLLLFDNARAFHYLGNLVFSSEYFVENFCEGDGNVTLHAESWHRVP